MHDNPPQFWQPLIELFVRPDWLEWPPLTAGQQTMGSWARAMHPQTSCPRSIRSISRRSTWTSAWTRPGSYFVLTPTYRGFLHRENEKLVFLASEQLYVVERTRAGLAPLCFPLQTLHYAEAGMILLHSWLTVRGLTSRRAVDLVHMQFNAVTARLFTPFLDADAGCGC